MFGTVSMGELKAGWSPTTGWKLVSNEAKAPAKAETNKAAELPKKGKPMCYDCDCDIEDVDNKRLEYAQGRVRSIAYNKRQDLRKQFNIDPPTAPADVEEMVQRIKDGKYSILPKEQDRYYWSFTDRLSWRLPDVKADQDGFNAAIKALDNQQNITMDIVTLNDNAGSLKALQDFEAWTYTA